MTGSIDQGGDRRASCDSLGWRDIFDLGGVWDRAKRIFTDPIDRLIDFGKGLVTGIITFVKDAILRPLAALAQGTRGCDLLSAVLGKDPITGDPVPRTAETLIGGFMKLIGQEEIWENIKKANAISRAWAWFQGALDGLMGFVRADSRDCSSRRCKSLELVDIVVLPRAFAKVVGAFGSFAVRFITWAGQQVLEPARDHLRGRRAGVMPYIRKAMGAFKTIIANPIGFVGNLVAPATSGFQQFAENFLTHLRTSLIEWLTGSLGGADIYIPQAFELREIVKFVLSVLGLTWANIRGEAGQGHRRDRGQGAGDGLRHRRDAGQRGAGRGLGEDQRAADEPAGDGHRTGHGLREAAGRRSRGHQAR